MTISFNRKVGCEISFEFTFRPVAIASYAGAGCVTLWNAFSRAEKKNKFRGIIFGKINHK